MDILLIIVTIVEALILGSAALNDVAVASFETSQLARASRPPKAEALAPEAGSEETIDTLATTAAGSTGETGGLGVQP